MKTKVQYNWLVTFPDGEELKCDLPKYGVQDVARWLSKNGWQVEGSKIQRIS